MTNLDEICMEPVGWVRATRREPEDDYWGDFPSVIELSPRFDVAAIRGLETFSHLEVVFWFHRVPDHKVRTGARSPRNRPDWPEVGIFAQRAKGRPNRLGVSRCRLVRVSGRRIEVRDLDAIDGTPVVDIKPYLVETGPIGSVSQPDWATELMAQYYAAAPEAAGAG